MIPPNFTEIDRHEPTGASKLIIAHAYPKIVYAC
jgi:hypothetical protein